MKVIDHLQKVKEPLISFELIPPKRGGDITDVLHVLDGIIKFRPPFIDITSHSAEVICEETPDGIKKKVKRKRPGTLGICALIQNKYNVDAVPHILVKGFTREETEDFMIELNYLGIDNVLAVRGDDSGYVKPIPTGRSANKNSVELVEQIMRMNKGIYLEDSFLDARPTNFCIGVGGYPEKHFEAPNIKADIKFAKEKIDAGADYIVTQMFYDNKFYFEFVDKCREAGITVPIIPGLKILTSKAQLHSIPKDFHVTIPSALADEIENAKPDVVLNIGVEWAANQVRELLDKNVPSVHFYVMLNSKPISMVMDARGLRVGGPYIITISKAGAGSGSQSDAYLNLDQVNQVNVALQPEVTTLQEVVAVAAGGWEGFSADKVGTGSVVTREQLEGFASIRRDLQDYARLDPRIAQTDKERGEISAGGQNTRFNSITIDGVTTNDTFGLESNNLPTDRQPIPMDAIEEVQVNVANYDVTQKAYTGANVNAVVKSGTNELHGSAYYIYRDSDMVGEDQQGNEFNGFIDDKTYGGTFGGPLLKDRLFFFTAYEKFERSSPRPDFCPEDASCSNNVTDITNADITEAQRITRDVWGFDAGSLDVGDLKNETENVLAKIDWNISDNHRASFTYTDVEQTQLIVPNFDRDDLSLNSHWYNQVKTFETFVGQLYSDWTDNFSTEVKLSWRQYDSEPENASRLPQVNLRLMSLAAEAGAVIFPPVPAFYARPQSLDGVIDNLVGRILARLGIENQQYTRWEGMGG